MKFLPLLFLGGCAAQLNDENRCDRIPVRSVKKAQSAGGALYVLVENPNTFARSVIASHANHTEVVADGIDFAKNGDSWYVLRRSGDMLIVASSDNPQKQLLRAEMQRDESVLGVAPLAGSPCVVTHRRVLCAIAASSQAASTQPASAPSGAVRLSQVLPAAPPSRVVGTDKALYVTMPAGLYRVTPDTGETTQLETDVKFLQARRDKPDCILGVWAGRLYERCEGKAARRLHDETELLSGASALTAGGLVLALSTPGTLPLPALPLERCGSTWLTRNVPLLVQALFR